MKVLVTGGAGFIGSNLVKELVSRGDTVTVIDNFSTGHRDLLDGFTGEVIEADVSRAFDATGPFDVVFHEASITDTTFDDDDEMMRQNVEGFRNVLTIALRDNARLVYASSAGVYGDGDIPMRENQAPRPLNAYAKSKLELDRIAREHYDRLTIVGVRYFNVFGPGEKYKGKSSSMIWQLWQQIASGKDPRIFKFGEQVRDHIYVKDVVAATILASQIDSCGIFNVGTGIATSFNDVIVYLNKVLGTDTKTEYFDNPYVGVYQDTTQADMTLSNEKLGFKAAYGVEEGIRDYVRVMK